MPLKRRPTAIRFALRYDSYELLVLLWEKQTHTHQTRHKDDVCRRIGLFWVGTDGLLVNPVFTRIEV